jgi:seryl-tRNA synthetase
MTTTKDELIGYIRNWVTTDSELKSLRSEIKRLNQEKKQLSNKLIEIMKQNEIETIDMNEGKLQYKKSTVKAPISKKHLISCLESYYKNDSSVIEELTTHILDSRETKVYESIKHKN